MDKNEKKEIGFTLKPVKKKPARTYRKGSKYDGIIDGFLESPEKLVQVEVVGKDANYLRTQLNKRIEARNLKGKISTSVVTSMLYLEKPEAEKPPTTLDPKPPKKE